MNTVLLILHLLVTLTLIGVVLIQRSEGGGLGIGTSQGMGSFMSGRGTANLLTRTTAILGAIFFALSLALALLNRGTAGVGRSILDIPPAQTNGAPSGLPVPPTPTPIVPGASSPVVPGASVSGTPAPSAVAPAAPGPVQGTAPAPAPAPAGSGSVATQPEPTPPAPTPPVPTPPAATPPASPSGAQPPAATTPPAVAPTIPAPSSGAAVPAPAPQPVVPVN